MKKLLLFSLALTVLFASGCASKKAPEEAPPPSPPLQSQLPPEPSPSAYIGNGVFDENGQVILDENGRVDVSAVLDGMEGFTAEELIKLLPYRDDGISDSLNIALGRRLLTEFDGVISLLAETDIPEEKGGIEQLARGVGMKIGFDLQSEAVSRADCEVLFAEHGLTERESYVLGKIVEGFNVVEFGMAP